MTAPEMIAVDPTGTRELVIAATAGMAVAEAERRGSQHAAAMTATDVNLHRHPLPGWPVVVVVASPGADAGLAGAVLARWRCQTSLIRLDERRRRAA